MPHFTRPEHFRLRYVLWENRKSLLRGTISLVVVDLIVFSCPYLVKLMVDRLQDHPLPTWMPPEIQNLSTLWFLALVCGLFIIASVFIALGRYYWRVFLIWSTFPWFHQMRMGFFKHVQNLHRDFFKHTKIGDLISALSTDTENLRMTSAIGSLMVIDAAINFILFPIILYYLDAKLMWMIVPALMAISFAAIFLTARLQKLYQDVQDITGLLSAKAYELSAGVRVIKAFRKESQVHDDFMRESEKLRESSIQVARYQSMFVPGLDYALALATIWVLIYGGYQVIDGKMPLSNLIAFQLYLNYMAWPMMAIGWFIQMFRQSKASENRIVKFIEAKNPLEVHSFPETSGKLLSIRDLKFRYSITEPEFFSGMNLDLEAGEWLGLSGPVGTGKTTWFELLSRQRDPESGAIYLEGKNLKSLSSEEVKREILYVPQESFMFSRSIRDNLTLGLTQKPKDEILWELLSDLSFDRDLIEGRGGLSTSLGERGVNLSGGQKQRLSLGRALLRTRKVYLFDDLFSHVDSETENKLILALKKYLPPQAVVILASQRVETLKICPKILVFGKNEIEFSGATHLAFKSSEFLKVLEELQSEEKRAVV